MVRINYKAMALLLLLFIISLFVGGLFIYGLFFICVFLVLSAYHTGRSTYRNLVSLVWKNSDKAVTGDSISLNMDFYNSGYIPIPYLKVNANLPRKLAGEEQNKRIYSLLPGIKATMSRNFECRHKGSYKIGYVETEFEDILGIFRWKKVFDEDIYLYVYPKVHILKQLDIPMRQQFGTISVKHSAYEDQAGTRDIRKYIIGDSFKKIHWKVTAHKGDFFVKNLELNASADLNVFLDLFDYGFPEDIASDIEEKGAECAASIIRYALSNSMSVSFTAKGEKTVTLTAKRVDGFGQFLEAISTLNAKGDMPISDLVRREARKLDWDATVLVISPCIDKAAAEAYISLRASGIEFVIVYLCKVREETNENLEMLRQNDFKIFVVSLEDDIRQVLGGNHEK